MKTVMLPHKLHVCKGDTVHITYNTPKGRIDKMFHSFLGDRSFDRIVVDECTKEDLDRFGISDGFIMVLANKDKI